MKTHYEQASNHVLSLVDINNDNKISYDESLLAIYALQEPIRKFHEELMNISQKNIPTTQPTSQLYEETTAQ